MHILWNHHEKSVIICFPLQSYSSIMTSWFPHALWLYPCGFILYLEGFFLSNLHICKLHRKSRLLQNGQTFMSLTATLFATAFTHHQPSVIPHSKQKWSTHFFQPYCALYSGSLFIQFSVRLYLPTPLKLLCIFGHPFQIPSLLQFGCSYTFNVELTLPSLCILFLVMSGPILMALNHIFTLH